MKTITRLLATAALLFGVLGGVSSVKAEKLYWSPASPWAGYANCKWTATTNQFSWDGTHDVVRAIQTGFSGNLSAYSVFHATISNLTGEGIDHLYLKINSEGGTEQLIKLFNGENNIDLTTYFSNINSTNVNTFELWGPKSTTKNCSAVITNVYLAEAVDQNVEITVGGEARNYQLYVPDKDLTNCPLVISLHGAHGASTNYSPFGKAVADEANCIVVYPQGKLTSFPIGFGGSATGWTATGENNFDVEFLKAVIEDVASKYQIDRKRIYCCGFSNGGMMTYAMANACSNEIAAFAAISGYPLNEFHLRHTGSRPVPFMHIHGKLDGFVLYEKMPTIVDEMVARLGANPVPTKTTVSGKYTKSVYGAGEGSFPYVYYEVDGMGHEAYTANTEDGNSALTMWNFFKDYSLDTPSDATLKWAPRIETSGFDATAHGWTMNDGTTLLSFGGAQYTEANKNVYASLQFESGKYKLCFKSAGASGKTIGVKIEKLPSPNTVVLNTTVNAGEDAELPFEISDGWGEYQLTMTRPDANDAITITDLVVTQTDAATPVASKKELTPTGSTFVTQTYKKFSVTGVPELAFSINPFSMTYNEVTYDDFYIDIAVPTTVGDWLFLKSQGHYWEGIQTISSGSSGPIKFDDDKETWTSLVLQAGNPDGARDLILKDVYYTKDGGATKQSILSTLGGTDVVVEEASAAGVKAFDMTNVDVSGYDKLVVSFTSPTIGEWVLNIDGTDETIPAGTQYYKVDVSGKTTLSNLTLSVGSGSFPRANNFDKLYLSNPVSISSDADWTSFATRVNGGETDLDVDLTTNVNAGGTMVGTASYPYAGTFDGHGYTITFSKDATEEIIAPFRYVRNATIQNVKTTGTITSTTKTIGGIVAFAQGTSTIKNCASSMNLSSTLEGENQDATIGGILGLGDNGANTTIEKCVYDGTITVVRGASGIVGYFRNNDGATFTLSNLVFAGTIISSNGSNICNIHRTYGSGTVEDCYYVNKANGTATDGTQDLALLRSGRLAYEFQGNNATQYWGQGYLNSSRSDGYPIFTSDASKKVYKEANGHYYANENGLLSDPALIGMLAWKHEGSPTAPYVYKLASDKKDNYILVGTSDGYVLNVTSAGATTLILPCDITTLPEGVKAYNLTFDGTTITATPTEDNKILANKPVLINAEQGVYTISTGQNYDKKFNFAAINADGTTNGALTGVYNTSLPFSYVPKDAYVLQNGAEGLGFYKVAADNTIKITSFRAYLTAQNAGARLSIKFVDNDEPTGVENLTPALSEGEGAVYDLQGRRVEKATKGLYIKNGKKVIMK